MNAPLDGITVLDLGQIYNGPYCALLLSYLGADVIKIEPLKGESTRRRVAGGESAAFVLLGSNRKAMCINLKSAEGRELLLKLASDADVLIENFAEGTMDRLQLGYDALSARNPRLIMASGRGFDSRSPRGDFLAMDLTVQAMSGIMSVTGFPDDGPVKAGVAISDIMGGATLAAGVLAALLHREHTGIGQHVEVAMQDAILPSLTSNIAAYIESRGTLPERTGNRHGGLALAPYNVYRTADGWISIFCVTERQWRSLLDVMERSDLKTDVRFGSMPDRAERIDEVDEIVSAWTNSRKAHDIFRQLTDVRIPCAPVVPLREIVDDTWFSQDGGMLPVLDHPTMGKVRAFGSPIRLSRADARLPQVAPLLGQHTDAVLKERLGMDGAEIARLRAEGVIN